MTKQQVSTPQAQQQHVADVKRHIRTSGWYELATLILLVFVTVLVSRSVAIAVLLGGILYLVPQWFFTLLTLRHLGAPHSIGVFLSTMIGFTGKLVFTAFGCAVIFSQYPDVAAGWLMTTLFFFYVYGLVVRSILI
ncbi:ATP synthase subunit I [Salinispirillum marinum]|uniref:ATP synthase subunit I n=2 Tax=Saccharospirillaceae TaxID=255527 RepID=A0ABV8BDG0_9GAMM